MPSRALAELFQSKRMILKMSPKVAAKKLKISESYVKALEIRSGKAIFPISDGLALRLKSVYKIRRPDFEKLVKRQNTQNKLYLSTIPSRQKRKTKKKK